MKLLNIVVIALGILIGFGVLVGQRREAARLQKELAGLRAEIRQLAQRPAPGATTQTPADFGAVAQGIQRSEEERAEIEKLRADVAAIKNRTQEIVRAQSANPTAAVPNKLIPLSAWKNAGRATPEAGIETALWAAAGGDLDTLANSIGFTATARQKADAFYASLSESTRQQYGSAEKLLALMIAKDAAAVAGMQILGQREVTPDDMGMRVRFADDQGRTKDSNFLLHHGSDGWRLVMNDETVEKFARQIKANR